MFWQNGLIYTQRREEEGSIGKLYIQAHGSEDGFTKFLFSIDMPHNITNKTNLRLLCFLVVTTFSSWALLCCWVYDRGYFTIIIKNYFLAWLICPSTWEAHFCTHLASPLFQNLKSAVWASSPLQKISSMDTVLELCGDAASNWWRQKQKGFFVWWTNKNAVFY